MTTKYQFAQFDPRPQGAEVNEKIFSLGAVLGIEVTIPALAVRCTLGNLDHHRPGDTHETPSACERAMTCELPPEGSVLTTVRSDADSITAMAVLVNRAENRSSTEGRSVDKDKVWAVVEISSARHKERVPRSLSSKCSKSWLDISGSFQSAFRSIFHTINTPLYWVRNKFVDP